MYRPETYGIALGFMFFSMFCWGSWANTVKLCPGYRFQLFYWDYVVGLLLSALAWGFTLGSFGSSGLGFVADITQTDARHIGFAVASGVIFNIANLLLVAAIDIAGLAVAFPVGIGLALVVGAVSSYLLAPKANPILLFGGVTLVIAAIACDARAYWIRESRQQRPSSRGVYLSLLSGLLMGSFYPFVSHSMSGKFAAGPFAAALFFTIGVAICAVPVNYLFMKRPLDDRSPVSMTGYVDAPRHWHFWGILGGVIWCTGAVLNFSASRSHAVGPAVSYSIGQGATMVSAAWGVFVWQEFAGAQVRSRTYLIWMFVLFAFGLTLVALAPLF